MPNVIVVNCYMSDGCSLQDLLIVVEVTDIRLPNVKAPLGSLVACSPRKIIKKYFEMEQQIEK